MIIKYNRHKIEITKPTGEHEVDILWEAHLMYSEKDSILTSISRMSKKQAKKNVMARYGRRVRGNLFLQQILSNYKKQVVREKYK